MIFGDDRKRIYVVVAIGVLALAALWMYFRSEPIPVETARVVRAQLVDTIDVEGRTRVKNKFTVTAPVSGKLRRIALREGDNILKNYPITEVDPNPPIPRSPIQSTDLPNLSNPYAANIFAPASGRILRIFEKSERFLEAGTPLLEIGDTTEIEIVVDVLSTDAVRIRPGLKMLVENLDSNEPVVARVRTIEPQASTKTSALGVEERRVDVIADFVGSKPPFGDNFRLDVHIVLWQGNDVLSIPNSALFRSGEDWNLFVVESGRAYLRKVSLGHRSSTDTQILDGVDEGDEVVVHPPNSLSDGVRIARQ